MIHRDLQPDHFMLLADQRSLRMIDFSGVGDLGERRRDQPNAARIRRLTEANAPSEQIVGLPEPRSDLFALAATLYHLATGQPPEGFYTARSIEAELAKPDCSYPAQYRWFFELIRTNLAEDANDRYFSAREFKADLERGQVTEKVNCPGCQHVNPVRQPYCGRCCQPLTDLSPVPCGGCGQNNRLGSRHCVHCNARLR
jgi:serine/threonine protein kinase